MARSRLSVGRGGKIAALIALVGVALSLIACQPSYTQAVQRAESTPTPPPTHYTQSYTQPFVQPFVVPIASTIGFVRSPAQPMTRSDRQFLNCYNVDSKQVCYAIPPSILLRNNRV